jgi:hypothetical protein
MYRVVRLRVRGGLLHQVEIGIYWLLLSGEGGHSSEQNRSKACGIPECHGHWYQIVG